MTQTPSPFTTPDASGVTPQDNLHSRASQNGQRPQTVQPGQPDYRPSISDASAHPRSLTAASLLVALAIFVALVYFGLDLAFPS